MPVKRRLAPLATALVLAACKMDDSPEPPWPELPELRPPVSHAPPPAPKGGLATDPRLVAGRAALLPRGPGPVRSMAAPAPSRPPSDPSRRPPLPPEDTVAEEPASSPEQEGTQWLLQANMVEPGCLLEDQAPELPLPSPEALAFVLEQQPQDFAGVAREALACRLGLPRLARAEVYGASAFRRLAMATRIGMAGGPGTGPRRMQGVVVAGVVADEPRAEGTLVVVLDELSGRWEQRSALWYPFEGDPATRALVSLRDVRLMSSIKESLVVREMDHAGTTDNYIHLTETQHLKHVLRLPVQRGEPKLVADVQLRGPGWPRTVSWRCVETLPDGTRRWVIESWEARPEDPYERTARLEGPLDIDGARGLLSAGQPADAEWLVGRLKKSEQSTAAALRLRAEASIARKHNRSAGRFWARAVKAVDATPDMWRDYGLFLAEHGKAKAAGAALLRYLEEAPEAADAGEIRSRLETLGKKKAGRKKAGAKAPGGTRSKGMGAGGENR